MLHKLFACFLIIPLRVIQTTYWGIILKIMYELVFTFLLVTYCFDHSRLSLESMENCWIIWTCAGVRFSKIGCKIVCTGTTAGAWYSTLAAAATGAEFSFDCCSDADLDEAWSGVE